MALAMDHRDVDVGGIHSGDGRLHDELGVRLVDIDAEVSSPELLASSADAWKAAEALVEKPVHDVAHASEFVEGIPAGKCSGHEGASSVCDEPIVERGA